METENLKETCLFLHALPPFIPPLSHSYKGWDHYKCHSDRCKLSITLLGLWFEEFAADQFTAQLNRGWARQAPQLVQVTGITTNVKACQTLTTLSGLCTLCEEFARIPCDCISFLWCPTQKVQCMHIRLTGFIGDSKLFTLFLTNQDSMVFQSLALLPYTARKCQDQITVQQFLNCELLCILYLRYCCIKQTTQFYCCLSYLSILF